MYEFDKMAATTLYGYSSVEDYIVAESSGFVCHNIDVPTLVINAEDDPLFTAEMVKRTAAFVEESDHMTYIQLGATLVTLVVW